MPSSSRQPRADLSDFHNLPKIEPVASSKAKFVATDEMYAKYPELRKIRENRPRVVLSFRVSADVFDGLNDICNSRVPPINFPALCRDIMERAVQEIKGA